MTARLARPLLALLAGALASTTTACESGSPPPPETPATVAQAATPTPGTGAGADDDDPDSARREAQRRTRARLGGRRQVLAERGGALDRRRELREARSREQSLTDEQRAAIDVLRQNSHHLHQCYLESLSEAGELRPADLRVRLDINPDGRASGVEVLENDLAETGIAACLTERIQAMGFPQTTGGVQLLHPLHFGPRTRP